MEYKKFGDAIYARFDRGDEIVSGLLDICRKENILSATYSGIGGCGDVTVASLLPETNEFLEHNKKGMMLEMISLNGNISADDKDNIEHHTHAMFSYLDENKEPVFLGGHLMRAVVLYTAEIGINPVKDGVIRRKHDEISGITVWKL